MKIGIPKEVKTLEGRVALIPAATAELVKQGHEVFIESGAGLLSGYTDGHYRDAGVSILDTADKLYSKSKLIVKVKEPQPEEWDLLRSDHLLFCYLHLAAEPVMTQALLKIGLTAVAFETVTEGRALPLLAPMSDIAGRLAVQIGAHLLHQPQGGRGILLGGLPGTERGRVVVLGGGVAGSNATRVAAALGAEVTVFEPNRDKQSQLLTLGANVTALQPYAQSIADAVKEADLLIGAVLIPGARAPHLVSNEMVSSMKAGSVIIDISVDQGGCIESTRPTSYKQPTYLYEGVVHFGVTNMPGAVPRTASQALSAAIYPYVSRLANENWQSHPGLSDGLNLAQGEIRLAALQG